jgi:hypothetical protein
VTKYGLLEPPELGCRGLGLQQHSPANISASERTGKRTDFSPIHKSCLFTEKKKKCCLHIKTEFSLVSEVIMIHRYTRFNCFNSLNLVSPSVLFRDRCFINSDRELIDVISKLTAVFRSSHNNTERQRYECLCQLRMCLQEA